MPTTMIRPMKDDTLNSVRVINNAKQTPDVDSTAEDKIAIGALYDRNSKSSTRKIKTMASTSTVTRSRKDFCCSAQIPPYSTRTDGGSFRSETVFCTALMAVPRS